MAFWWGYRSEDTQFSFFQTTQEKVEDWPVWVEFCVHGLLFGYDRNHISSYVPAIYQFIRSGFARPLGVELTNIMFVTLCLHLSYHLTFAASIEALSRGV